MTAIFLTGCVFPAVSVQIQSPQRRLAEMIAAIGLWGQTAGVDSITVCEASGFRPDLSQIPHGDKPLDWLAWDLADVGKRWGKGRSESLLIERGLLDSQALANADNFCKVTGRIFVANCGELISGIAGKPVIGCSGSVLGMNTRFFYADKHAYQTWLQPHNGEIDDARRETWIEAVQPRYSSAARVMFTHRQRCIGCEGTWGNVLDGYYPDSTIQHASQIAADLLGGNDAHRSRLRRQRRQALARRR